MHHFNEAPRHLTPREIDVLRLITKGFTAKELGLQLNIGACTVERHIENIRLKTRTRNRAHMVSVAIGEGWLNEAISV